MAYFVFAIIAMLNRNGIQLNPETWKGFFYVDQDGYECVEFGEELFTPGIDVSDCRIIELRDDDDWHVVREHTLTGMRKFDQDDDSINKKFHIPDDSVLPTPTTHP